jgi:hypothetical protein
MMTTVKIMCLFWRGEELAFLGGGRRIAEAGGFKHWHCTDSSPYLDRGAFASAGEEFTGVHFLVWITLVA